MRQHLCRILGMPLLSLLLGAGMASGADKTVNHEGGALLFPSTKQLAGSTTEQGLLQDHQAQAIAATSKPIRVPNATTVEVVREESITCHVAGGADVAVPVVYVRVTSSGLTDGVTGKAIGFQAATGYLLKERLQ